MRLVCRTGRCAVPFATTPSSQALQFLEQYRPGILRVETVPTRPHHQMAMFGRVTGAVDAAEIFEGAPRGGDGEEIIILSGYEHNRLTVCRCARLASL